jgi:hypothetical protein
MPRSELTTEQTEALIDEAREAFPDSDFVDSVADWYGDNGFITEAQEQGLNNTIERSGRNR